VPWGPFTDWLYHRDSGAYTPAGPNHHVAAVYLLAGLFARWDVRPDAEQAAVTRRRAELVGALAGLADLPPTLRPSPHPPASLADRAREQGQVEAAWPWQPGPDEDARAVALSYLYGSVRREIHALADAVATVQRDIFGGEDPLHPRVRASLAGLLEADALTRAWWDAIAAAPLWSDEHPWPAPATYDEPETAARVAEFLQALADR